MGVPEEDGPPDVELETLEDYCEYLMARLRFPFEGEYQNETGPLEILHFSIRMTGLSRTMGYVLGKDAYRARIEKAVVEVKAEAKAQQGNV